MPSAIDKAEGFVYNASDESYPLAFVSVTDTCGDVRKGELPKLIVAPEEIKSRLWLFFRVGRVSDYKNQPLYEIKPTAVCGLFCFLSVINCIK